MSIACSSRQPDFTIKSRYGKWTSTLFAETAFKRMLPGMGNIVRIIGTAENREYLVTFFSEDGRSFEFYGFAWWYHGEGPMGLTRCLAKLGVKKDILNRLNSYSAEHHGDVDHPNCFFISLGETHAPS